MNNRTIEHTQKYTNTHKHTLKTKRAKKIN